MEFFYPADSFYKKDNEDKIPHASTVVNGREPIIRNDNIRTLNSNRTDPTANRLLRREKIHREWHEISICTADAHQERLKTQKRHVPHNHDCPSTAISDSPTQFQIPRIYIVLGFWIFPLWAPLNFHTTPSSLEFPYNWGSHKNIIICPFSIDSLSVNCSTSHHI